MPVLCLVAHDAPTGPDVAADDLPGSGRLDLVCRAAATTLLTSHGIREDWTVDLVLLGPPDPPRRIVLDGGSIRDLNPDERSTALLLQKVLAEPAPGRTRYEVRDGISTSGQGLDDVLDERSAEGPVLLLDEAGDDVGAVDLPAEATFVCSDHRDLADAEREAVLDVADATVSLGPTALQVHQAVAVLQNRLDRGRQR